MFGLELNIKSIYNFFKKSILLSIAILIFIASLIIVFGIFQCTKQPFVGVKKIEFVSVNISTTKTSASVSYTTNIPAKTVFSFNGNNYSSLGTNHTISLNGLLSDTSYSFTIFAEEAIEQEVYHEPTTYQGVFITSNLDNFSILNIKHYNFLYSSIIRIKCETDIPAVVQVFYKKTSDSIYQNTNLFSPNNLNHNIDLNPSLSISPGDDYVFYIQATALSAGYSKPTSNNFSIIIPVITSVIEDGKTPPPIFYNNRGDILKIFDINKDGNNDSFTGDLRILSSYNNNLLFGTLIYFNETFLNSGLILFTDINPRLGIFNYETLPTPTCISLCNQQTTGIQFYNSNRYVSGYYNTDSTFDDEPCYWINNTRIDLPKGALDSITTLGIFISSSGTIFIYGKGYLNSDGSQYLVLWIDGILYTKNLGTNPGYIKGIIEYNSNIYIFTELYGTSPEYCDFGYFIGNINNTYNSFLSLFPVGYHRASGTAFIRNNQLNILVFAWKHFGPSETSLKFYIDFIETAFPYTIPVYNNKYITCGPMFDNNNIMFTYTDGVNYNFYNLYLPENDYIEVFFPEEYKGSLKRNNNQ